MPHTTTSTKHHHAKERQLRCELSETLKGGYCENPGTQSTKHGLLCEKHAKQLGLEEQVACWEAILLHIELWTKVAHRRAREDVVRLLNLERVEVVAALERVYEDLRQAEHQEGYQPNHKREIYGFMS